MNWINDLRKKLMFKRSVCFISLILLISISVFAAIDEIAIFNEQVAWSTPDAAEKATDYIVKNVKSAKSIKTLNKVEIADFVKKNIQRWNNRRNSSFRLFARNYI